MKELEELGRLRRELGTRILQAIMEAWPAEEPRCEHGAGPGYCDKEGCPHG